MIPPRTPIASILSASPHAQVLRSLDLGFERSARIWRNSDDHVTYDATDGHTFSFYIRGGHGARRMDGRPQNGWPGAVCVFPHGQSSVWEITEPFVFVHLYVPDAEMRRSYAETFDRDARLLELADLTYVEAGELARPFGALVAAAGAGNALHGESAMAELIASVFASGRFSRQCLLSLKGGLAPLKRRRLLDFIEARLDRTIRLRDLAGIAGLSEFHLQRSFQAECGVSPHGWIARRRIARATALIRSGEALSQIALACGFSSQSHFSRAFKAGTGLSPQAYRKELA